MEEILRFSFGRESIEGTVLKKRLEQLVANQGGAVVYKPKNVGYNKNLHKYSPEILEYIKQVLRPLLIYFGYVKVEGIENQYGFIDIGKLSGEEMEQYNGFMKNNAAAMKESIKFGDKIGEKYLFDNASWPA